MAGSGVLVVDFDLLGQCRDQMKAVREAFRTLKSDVSDAAEDWGDDQIAGAMHTFATNWSYHRAKMSDKLDKGVDRFDTVIKTFQDADNTTRDMACQMVQVSK